MIEQQRYDILWGAFCLACEELAKSNMEITDDNLDMLEHKIHGSLKGFFLMKAEKLLSKTENTNDY